MRTKVASAVAVAACLVGCAVAGTADLAEVNLTADTYTPTIGDNWVVYADTRIVHTDEPVKFDEHVDVTTDVSCYFIFNCTQLKGHEPFQTDYISAALQDFRLQMIFPLGFSGPVHVKLRADRCYFASGLPCAMRQPLDDVMDGVILPRHAVQLHQRTPRGSRPMPLPTATSLDNVFAHLAGRR